jgi:single-stranded-DNA-specific exonuclease
LKSSNPDLVLAGKKLPIGQCLALATLGTIADVMPLKGLNRALVNEGLKELSFTDSPGLRSLKDVSGVHGLVSAQAVGFQLGPRINAMGRVVEEVSPGILKAIGLFISEDEAQASELAHELSRENLKRKDIERKGVLTAIAEIDQRVAELGVLPEAVFVKEGAIHPGVAGIIAARLVERYGCLVAVVGEADANGICRGSVRSPAGINAIELLEESGSGVLMQCGGHAAAAGFSLFASEVGKFEAELNRVLHLRGESNKKLQPPKADIEVRLSELVGRKSLENDLEIFEPCGHGNPSPSFYLKDVTIVATRMLTGGHAEVLFRQGSAIGTALYWNRNASMPELRAGDTVGLIVESHPRDFLRRFDVRARGNVFGIKAVVV